MRIQDAQLKRFVIDSGLVPRKDIDAAEKKAKEEKSPLAETLVSSGAMTEDDLRRVESYVLGVPFVSLKDKKIDFIAAPESRGFIFATPVSYLLNCGVTPIRKPGKLPAKTIEHSYELEYGSDTLCIHEDAFAGVENPQVIIIDDLLATGGSCSATIELVKKAGGTVVGAGFVIELGFLNAREKLEAQGVEVFSILNI